MKLGFKLLSASLALSLALYSLCSCSTTSSSQGSGSSAASSSTPKETKTAETSVPADKTEATSTPGDDSDGEYVYTAKEYSAPFSGSFGITGETDISGDNIRNRIPLLKIDSEDAAAINAEIKNDFETELGSETADGTDTHSRTDYIAPVNGEILSLVIENRTMDTPQSSFWVYNINTQSEENVDKSALFEQAGIPEDEALDKIRADIEERFSTLPDDYSSTNYAAEAKEASLAEENLELTDYYLGENGSLFAVYILHWVAGAEIYCTLLNLSE